MMIFQAFTNNSKAFKDQFCPKTSKKCIKKEGETILKRGGQQNRGWVLEIEGCPPPFHESLEMNNSRQATCGHSLFDESIYIHV